MPSPNKGGMGLVDRQFQPNVGRMQLRCSQCHSKTASLFCDLDISRQDQLYPLIQTRMYPAGATVFMEGDDPRAACCVCCGRIKLSSSSPDGRVVIVSIAVSGDILGVRPILLGTSQDLTATTTEDCLLCFISKEDFLGFLQANADISLRLSQKLSAELHQAYRKVSGAVLKPPKERLMELLLALCHTHGEPTPTGIQLQTNLCQEELAEFLGVSRRSLNRALAQLRWQGFIECRRRSILVRDTAAVRNWLDARASS